MSDRKLKLSLITSKKEKDLLVYKDYEEVIQMKYDFIKVNKTIFDYKRYIKEVEWLKYDVKRRLLNLLERDFITVEEFEERYDHLRMSLYNERFDLKIEICCNKNMPEIFI